jgi:thymidylate synthase (FAD)
MFINNFELTQQEVELVTITEGVNSFSGTSMEEIIVGQARVSTDKTGEVLFDSPEKLIKSLLRKKHWSPFDMVNLGFSIKTTIPISLELIRHWSIKPQQFSARYSKVQEYIFPEMRKQAEDNRQSSTELIHLYDKEIMDSLQKSFDTYEMLIQKGIARETARMVLPQCVATRLYMYGSVRSWLTFLSARLHKTSQLEIRQIAREIATEFKHQFPTISQVCNNFQNAEEEHLF